MNAPHDPRRPSPMTCEAHGTRPCLCISLSERLFLPPEAGNRSPVFDSSGKRKKEKRDPCQRDLS